MRERWLFSYVVDHDEAYSPNPVGGLCTLVNCKFSQSGRRNIVELAQEGDWIAGTGGKSPLSAGHGRLIYAMRISRRIPLSRYLAAPEFAGRADRFLAGEMTAARYALIADEFYYFGYKAIAINSIPTDHINHPIEKHGPGFRRDFTEAFIRDFESWLRKAYRTGIYGEPCAGPPSHWRRHSTRRRAFCQTAPSDCQPTIKCIVKPPSQCSPFELQQFHELAVESGEVSPTGLSDRIRDAYRLAFLFLHGETVGIGALKTPRASYRAKVGRGAGVELSDTTFPYELGWVYIRELAQGHRGSTNLTQSLIAEVEQAGVYATSATDKERMHRTLKRHGFVHAGNPYSSAEILGRKLMLFIRPAPAHVAKGAPSCISRT